MSEFKGTKGKWELFEGDNFSEVQIKLPSLKSICAVNPNIEEHRANAKLIACAPQMLEMLIRAEQWILNCSEEAKIVIDIKELIQKATE